MEPIFITVFTKASTYPSPKPDKSSLRIQILFLEV
jgi:hypothetical protein